MFSAEALRFFSVSLGVVFDRVKTVFDLNIEALLQGALVITGALVVTPCVLERADDDEAAGGGDVIDETDDEMVVVGEGFCATRDKNGVDRDITDEVDKTADPVVVLAVDVCSRLTFDAAGVVDSGFGVGIAVGTDVANDRLTMSDLEVEVVAGDTTASAPS